ncbi:MAG: SRPBCC family protein [Thermoplasmata archaeon]|nr:SRPBCC family protein [Candidatus Thermoplasmatota archaeon]
MRLDLSQFIDRPPAEVFSFYAVNHVRNHPRWDPDMELEQLTEGPIDVGTVIRRRHTHYGEPSEGTMEVVEYELNRAFGVVIHDGPIEIHGRTSVEPEAEGGTRLTMGIEIPGSTNPIDPALLERTLRNIKKLIESEVPRTS